MSATDGAAAVPAAADLPVGDAATDGHDDDDDVRRAARAGAVDPRGPRGPRPNQGPPPQRGIDAGLAKSAPDASEIDAHNYRDFRRRLEVFERMCMRRGPDAVAEGAFMILNTLRGEAWMVTETIDLNELETINAFEVLRREIDMLYRYEPEVEMPSRCEDFFNTFCREAGETLNTYIARRARARTRLNEAGVPLPDKLAGWHLMSRAAIPRWQEPTLRAHCRNVLTVRNVTEAL